MPRSKSTTKCEFCGNPYDPSLQLHVCAELREHNRKRKEQFDREANSVAKQLGLTKNSIAAGGCDTGGVLGGSTYPGGGGTLPGTLPPMMPTPFPGVPNTMYVPPGSSPHVEVEKLGDRHVRLEFPNLPTEQAVELLTHDLPKALSLFLEKNAGYDAEHSLGLRGEFVEMWRKLGKLKKAIWRGEKLVGEQTPEVLQDLFGHLLLALNAERTNKLS